MAIAIAYFKDFAVKAAPALKAAFVKAAKVGAYIVLSAAIAAAYAFIEQEPFDPSVAFIVNTALAALTKAVETLRAE